MSLWYYPKEISQRLFLQGNNKFKFKESALYIIKIKFLDEINSFCYHSWYYIKQYKLESNKCSISNMWFKIFELNYRQKNFDLKYIQVFDRMNFVIRKNPNEWIKILSFKLCDGAPSLQTFGLIKFIDEFTRFKKVTTSTSTYTNKTKNAKTGSRLNCFCGHNRTEVICICPISKKMIFIAG